MASAQMLSSKTGALSGTSINKPAPFKAQRVMINSRPRTVVVKAAQAPNELVLKTFGALAAAQLALLPVAAPAMADLLPKTATSQAARDKLNAKTSALPSLKKTAENAGEAISGDVDIVQGAKDAANALDNATGGDLAGQAKSTAKKATNKASGALPSNPAKDLANKASSALPSNPARDFANRAKSAGDKAKAAVSSNPAKDFANRAKAAVRDAIPTSGSAVFDTQLLQKDVSQVLQQKTAANAKQLGAKAKSAVADVPSPADFANKAKKVANKATGSIPNPSDFGNKAKQAANKASGSIPNPSDFTKQANKAKSQVKKATSDFPNPARDFANAAKAAKAKVNNTSLNLPVAAPVYDYSALQTDVGFLGFGNKAKQAVQSKVSDAKDQAGSIADKAGDVRGNVGDLADKAGSVASKAGDVGGNVGAIADKAGSVGDKVAETADKAASGNSFNIFDAGSVKEAQKTLKQNVENAAAERSDPAERVFPIGKPGETQEDNAERIRIQSENGATAMGDARAPTSIGEGTDSGN